MLYDCIFLLIQMLKEFSWPFQLTLKREGGEGGFGGGEGGQFDPPCGFSKNVSSKEKVKAWFFVTFNIISKHKFP